jgi:hypothetical protein
MALAVTNLMIDSFTDVRQGPVVDDTERPAHDEAGEQVEGDGEIQLAADDELRRVRGPALMGAAAVSCRSSRLSATGWSWSLIVVHLKRFRGRALGRLPA